MWKAIGVGMIYIIGIGAFFLGGIFGVTIMATVCASKRKDENYENIRRSNKSY